MDSEDKFWASVWFMATITFLGLVTTIAVYSSDKNAKIVEALKNGVPALEVMCALGNSDNVSTCAVLAAKK